MTEPGRLGRARARAMEAFGDALSELRKINKDAKDDAYDSRESVLAAKNDVYKELLEMNQSSGTEREEELMAVHAKAFSKMGGANGANGPQIEMKLIADYFASQNSGGGGSGGGSDDDDDDHQEKPKTF